MMIGGDWHFVGPQQGIAIFDRAAGHLLVFRDGWELAGAPASPSGGTVIDAEARAAVAALVQALVSIGVLAES